MIKWAPIRPKRAIFNVFEKGKDYFYLRAAIEAIMLVYLLGTVWVITRAALGIYPTVVRDVRGQSYVGSPSPYETTPNEMVQFISSTVETMYLRTEAGSTTKLVTPFVAQAIRTAVLAAAPGSGGFVQTAAVTRVLPYQSSGTRLYSYVQVEFELNTFDRVLVDVGYFNAQLTKGGPTKSNPSGWVLTGWLEMPKELFLREQERLAPDETDRGPVAPADKKQQLLDLQY